MTLCPWKGLARHYSVRVHDHVLDDGAWYYPHPTPLARTIKNHVAFKPPVRIEGEAHEVSEVRPAARPKSWFARLRALLRAA